jgi:hypothetical protein
LTRLALECCNNTINTTSRYISGTDNPITATLTHSNYKRNVCSEGVKVGIKRINLTDKPG